MRMIVEKSMEIDVEIKVTELCMALLGGCSPCCCPYRALIVSRHWHTQTVHARV